MSYNLPSHIEEDLVAGFKLTDIDDGYQRCKKISPTTYLYRCDVNGEVYEEEINIDLIDKTEAISGFYDSIEELIETHGTNCANMIIAECYFENNCPMQVPK